MGFGDVKLAAVMGLYLGWLGWTDALPVAGPLRLVFYALMLGCVLGVVFGLAVQIADAPPRRLPLRPGAGLGLLRGRALRLRAELSRLPAPGVASLRPPSAGASRRPAKPARLRPCCAPPARWCACRRHALEHVPALVRRTEGGRRPMAVSTERDPVALRDDLGRWLGARTGATHVEVGEVSIPGLSGFSNETLLFEATWDGEVHPLVIRVEPTGHTVFPATAFDTQVQVMRALRAEGTVPVPDVLWFEEDPSILGARFLCMRRVDGQVPADATGLPRRRLDARAPARSATTRVGERDRHDGPHPPARPRRARPRLDRRCHARGAARPRPRVPRLRLRRRALSRRRSSLRAPRGEHPARRPTGPPSAGATRASAT